MSTHSLVFALRYPNFQLLLYVNTEISIICSSTQLYTNRDPFPDLRDSQISRHVVSRKLRPNRPSLPSGPEMASPLWEVLNRCWTEVRTERPGAEELVSTLTEALRT